MSNRNLMHYFSPNVTKPTEATSPIADDVPRDNAVNNSQSVAKRSRTGGSKVKSIAPNDDDDFEDDHSIFPSLNGNSITKYFSPVDRTTTSKRKTKPCKMTVEVQVHGSPKKQAARVPAAKKVTKRKKRKTGIPSSLADTIELVSSEEMVTESSSSPEVTEIIQLPAEPQIATPKTQWKMKIRLEETVKLSSDDNDDTEDSDFKEGPRRSTRLRFKPISLREDEPKEVELQKTPNKKRKKEARKRKVEDDIKIISEDIAPVFLKKKWEEEARAIKKAKQDFLFSGVPEVLKQQTAVQTALEQRPVEIFPKISHVTQAGSRPWHLPYPAQLSLILRKIAPRPEIKRPTTFSSSLNTCHVDSNSIGHRSASVQQASCLEWRFCKDWITRLKEDYSLSFPFFRTLRMVLSRVNKKGGGGEDLPWTDAYAPKESVDILANNRKPAQRLKNWLNQWKLRAGEEATLSPKKSVKKVGKRKRIASDDSDSEEAVIDDSSRDSWKPEEEELCNCVLLVGPAGCGKTATIYALAEELGYNVLEVNASSKRNGKTVLSHLHEATQSHSLNNNSGCSVANSMNKLFFGGKVAAKPARQEAKTSLSLVLFEDVDIVFESEDESFYSALTTLIQTSKRPIVLTLGSTEERTLTLIQDKIKSHFDTFSFMSPDLSTTCGYLWCLCLAEGYPLEWSTLEKWVRSRTVINFDLRSLLLELQFLLQSHPLRLKLNFSQLQLKNDEENPNCETGWKTSNDSSDKIPVQLIELPVTKGFQEWPYTSPPKSLRFTYDVDRDTISVVESKDKKRFSRILPIGSPDEPDTLDGSIAVDKVPSSKKEKWCGDLTHLARCLDLRASNELFSSCLVSDRLSWSGAGLMLDIQQFIADRCIKLMEKDLGERTKSSRLESCMSEPRNDQLSKSANHFLLESSIPRSMLLQRDGHSADVLPYLRSFLRLDLERCVGKRRRKQRTRLESPTTRLPTLDLVMSTSSAVQLANNF